MPQTIGMELYTIITRHEAISTTCIINSQIISTNITEFQISEAKL
jgi:hypothetical protein